MTDNAVFIFVSAGNCGGCVRFKEHFWERTKAELAKITGLRVVDMPVPKLGEPLPPDAHRDLARFVSWYPTFILINKSSYEKVKLEGVVFNGVEGKVVGGAEGRAKWDLVPVAQRRATDNVSVVSWVKEQLSSNPIFKKGVTFSPLGVKGILKAPKSEKEQGSEDEDGEIYTASYCQQAFLPFS